MCICVYLHKENDNVLILSKLDLNKVFLELAIQVVAFNSISEIT